jgi:predicted nucleic acid-binding Zn ribbon protein
LAIVLSVLLRFTASDCLFWPLFCLFSFDSQLLVASFGHCFVCSHGQKRQSEAVNRRRTDKTMAKIGNQKLWIEGEQTKQWPKEAIRSCESKENRQINGQKRQSEAVNRRRTDKTILVASFGHCFVCSPSIHSFWLPLLAIVLSVLLRFTASDCLFWPLFCLFSFDLQLLIASFGHCSNNVTYRK